MASSWSRFPSWNRRTISPHVGHFRCDADGTAMSSPLIGSFSRPRASFIIVPQEGQASSGRTRPRIAARPVLLRVFFMTSTFVLVERHDHAVLAKDDLDADDLSPDVGLEHVHPLAGGF